MVLWKMLNSTCPAQTRKYAKISSILYFQCQKKLPYYGVDKTAGELRQIINEMNIFDDNDKIIPDPEDPDTVQDINEEKNLMIERWINLNSEEFNSNFDGEIMEVQVFIDNEDENNENDGDNQDNENNENGENHEKWDPEEAANRYTED